MFTDCLKQTRCAQKKQTKWVTGARNILNLLKDLAGNTHVLGLSLASLLLVLPQVSFTFIITILWLL